MKYKPAVGKGDRGSDIWFKEDNKYKDGKDTVTQPEKVTVTSDNTNNARERRSHVEYQK